jgi:hypothetical protein
VRGADGGVALDVFDRAHARTNRPCYVGDCSVSLDIDKLILLAAGHPPQHQTWAGFGDRNLGKRRRITRWQTKFSQCCPADIQAFSQATGQVHDTVGRARDTDPREVLAGDEAAKRRVVAQTAAGLTEQVHRRIPATAHEQHVAGDGDGCGVGTGPVDYRVGDAFVPMRSCHD